MSYIIITKNNSHDLAVEVRKFINLGWRPYGSLVTAPSAGNDNFYHQPMIRREERLVKFDQDY